LELPRLHRSKTEAYSLIDEQIKRGRQINPLNLTYGVSNQRYRQWDRETHALLLELFNSDRYAKEYEMIADGIDLGGKRNREWRAKFDERMNAKIGLLKEFQRRIDKHLVEPSPNQGTDFWALIHPDIIAVAKSRFETGHYADCAEAAFKQINSVVKDIVKTATGKELDGAGLMKTAFSANSPVIEIEGITTETGRNIQQGYMEMFAGSMTGIRNPKAHAVIMIGRERAIHFIFLASLLMDTIDIAFNKYRHAGNPNSTS
jgi:uncharacterized protein (TIGR02391 family)